MIDKKYKNIIDFYLKKSNKKVSSSVKIAFINLTKTLFSIDCNEGSWKIKNSILTDLFRKH